MDFYDNSVSKADCFVWVIAVQLKTWDSKQKLKILIIRLQTIDLF